MFDNSTLLYFLASFVFGGMFWVYVHHDTKKRKPTGVQSPKLRRSIRLLGEYIQNNPHMVECDPSTSILKIEVDDGVFVTTSFNPVYLITTDPVGRLHVTSNENEYLGGILDDWLRDNPTMTCEAMAVLDVLRKLEPPEPAK